MRLSCSLLISCVFLFGSVFCESSCGVSDDALIAFLPFSDSVENEDSDAEKDHLDDAYLEGYLQAMIDTQFHGSKVRVVVRNGDVYLAGLPKNRAEAKSIIAMVQRQPGVLSVKAQISEKKAKELQNEYVFEKPKIRGIWFPQNTVLFPPLIASARVINSSMAYRWQSKEASKYMGKRASAVSFGDDFPIFRWINLGRNNGEVQIGIQGAAWAVFRFDTVDQDEFAELVNTDFFLGIPVSYAFDKWSFRFRLYHVSGHLGDEFIVTHSDFERKNPSFEAVDLFASYQLSENIRLYLGVGNIFHSDKSYYLQPLYVEYGTEVRFFRRRMYYNKLYGQVFVAVDFNNYEARGWGTDQTYSIGYEWSKLRGAGRKFRVFGQAHDGFAADGQFFKMRLNYLSVNFSYGF